MATEVDDSETQTDEQANSTYNYLKDDLSKVLLTNDCRSPEYILESLFLGIAFIVIKMNQLFGRNEHCTLLLHKIFQLLERYFYENNLDKKTKIPFSELLPIRIKSYANSVTDAQGEESEKFYPVEEYRVFINNPLNMFTPDELKMRIFDASPCTQSPYLELLLGIYIKKLKEA